MISFLLPYRLNVGVVGNTRLPLFVPFGLVLLGTVHILFNNMKQIYKNIIIIIIFK